MSNNKLSKIILWAGIFAVSLGLGFVGVRLIKKDNPDIMENSTGIGDIPSAINSDSLTHSKNSEDSCVVTTDEENRELNKEEECSDESTSVQEKGVQEPKVTISATKPKLKGDLYEFVAIAKNLPSNESYHFELWSSKGKKVQSSNNGIFSDVPGISGGKYTLWLVDSKKNRIKSINVRGFNLINRDEDDNSIADDPTTQDEVKPEKPKRMLISKDEFQSKLLNANDLSLKSARRSSDKKSFLSKDFYLEVIGMNSDEKKRPTDIEGVREKIHFEIWKSAIVVDISYDEVTGQVTKAVVKPVY